MMKLNKQKCELILGCAADESGDSCTSCPAFEKEEGGYCNGDFDCEPNCNEAEEFLRMQKRDEMAFDMLKNLSTLFFCDSLIWDDYDDMVSSAYNIVDSFLDRDK